MTTTMKKANVLVVDDNPTNLGVLVDYFTQVGFEVSVALDGEGALELLEFMTPDVILLDVMMPGIDGFETCRRIKALPQTQDIPVIFMTALSETTDKVKGFEAGAVDYVTKPFQHEEVRARIMTHLTLRNLQQGLQAKNIQLEQLHRFGQRLTATFNLQQIADQLAQTATDIIGTQSVSVWLWDKEAGELVCWMSSDMVEKIHDLRLKQDQGIAGWVVQHGQTVIAQQAYQDPRFFAGFDRLTGFETRSLLAAPMQIQNDTIGVVEVLNKHAGDFTGDDKVLVETFAASAAIAIENARLVEALKQHSDDLEAQNAELDAFAHTVAHDLKNPLNALTGYSDMLVLRKDLELPDEEIDELAADIVELGRKMANIVDELLLLASVHKMDQVEVVPLAMEGIVAEAQKRLSEDIARSRAEIHTASDWPVAVGHAAWVEEVWANYISNALKYGGDPPKIEIGATPQLDGMVRFWVRDNGQGLSEEQQAQLFTKFTRLHQVKVEGQGLGLSIVQRIVERLNGQVGVVSRDGEGSEFYFTLPAGAEG